MENPQAKALLTVMTTQEVKQFKRMVAYITRIIKMSRIFATMEQKTFPQFSESDIEIGNELGRGEYCVVSEITRIKPPPELSQITSSVKQQLIEEKKKRISENLNVDNDSERDSSEFKTNATDGEDFMTDLERETNGLMILDLDDANSESDEDAILEGVHIDHAFMSRECIRNGFGRYAIKQIRPDHESGKAKKQDSIIDLALEAQFLSVLSHPNIIKMRGIGVLPCHEKFFIVLDRLNETLGQKIEMWDDQIHKMKRPFWKKRDHKKEFWPERIIAAYDIARALRYMHRIKIVYRDLKPENIGFDVRGIAKVFDFGLSKELHPRDATHNGLYKLSGVTGTRRYMAPEVVMCAPYNEKVDVFSFGMLLWEMCALEPPFLRLNVEEHSRRVVRQGFRPKIENHWPIVISDIIQLCWKTKAEERPPFDKICTMLGSEVSQYLDDDDDIGADRTQKMLDASVCSRRDSFLHR